MTKRRLPVKDLGDNPTRVPSGALGAFGAFGARPTLTGITLSRLNQIRCQEAAQKADIELYTLN